MPDTPARSELTARWSRRSRLRFVGSHQIALLQSGSEYFPALIAAIDAACESIRLETYIFHDDEAGRAVADALARAAERGVSVHLLIDGFGTPTLSGEASALIGAAAVRVRVFRPLRLAFGLRLRMLRRLHRKLCVIDGTDAFVGGINILDDRVDLRAGALDEPRLDFALRLRGAVVPQIEQAMIAAWEESAAHERPRLAIGGMERPTLDRARLCKTVPTDEAVSCGLDRDDPNPTGRWLDRVRVALALRDNVRNRRTIERAYLRAIGRARREVLIACAYFLPGRRFRRALVAAARRGVRVRLLLQGRIEYAVPHFGTQSLYQALLAEGVQIFEYDPSFLHAKVAIADDWATVGSSNIDPLSLLLAREANIVVRSTRFASLLRVRLEEAIDRGGKPIALEHLQRQPWWRRAAARAAWWLLRIGIAVSGKGLRY